MDSKDTCPSGGKHNPITYDETGEKICRKCGNVLGISEPTDPEYKDRPEAKEGKNFALGTWIGKNKKERKKVMKSVKYVERFDVNLAKGKEKIETYAKAITPQTIVIERATELFTKVRRKLQRNTNALAAACVLYACRQYKIPISPTKLANITHVKKGKFTSIYREIYGMEDTPLPLDKAVNKVRLVASKVGLSEKIVRKAEKILEKIPSSETGSSPMGIAAAVLFLASMGSKYSVTQRQLAEAAEMNQQAITNSVKRLNQVLKKYKIRLS